MTSPKMPPPPPLPPPPVTQQGPEKVAADLEARRRQGKKYDFTDTILSPAGLKTTLG